MAFDIKSTRGVDLRRACRRGLYEPRRLARGIVRMPVDALVEFLDELIDPWRHGC